MKITSILALLLVLLTGCSVFNDGYTQGNITPINSGNLNSLSGNYQMFAHKKYNENGSSVVLSSDKKAPTLYSRINNVFPSIKNLNDLKNFVLGLDLGSYNNEWNTNDVVEVQFNGQYANFKVMKAGKEYMNINYKGKIKKGFFVLSNENNCVKVLMVFSGCADNNKRIGLSRDGELLVLQYVKYDVTGIKIPSVLTDVGSSFELVYSFQKAN